MNDISFICEHTLPARDWYSEWASKLSRELAAKKDELIREAINRRIGTDWKLEDMRGRLNLIIDARKPEQVLCLDGTPILELHPLTTGTSAEGHATMMNASFQWRFL